MPSLDIALFILVLLAMATVIPVGNENSMVRRVPWVTCAIIGLNVVVFVFVITRAPDSERFVKCARALDAFLKANPELMSDREVLRILTEASKETGVKELEDLGKQPAQVADAGAAEPKITLPSAMNAMRANVVVQVAELRSAAGYQVTYYRWGVAPNGEWRWYQLITYAFLHGGIAHLLGNMIFFFAIGFSLEDLWGRGVFLGFYLLAAIASALPYVLNPDTGPLIGASGAVSATMGAFLIRSPRTRIELRFIPFLVIMPLLVPFKRFWYPFRLAAYIYIPLFFVGQAASMWYQGRMANHGAVAYSAHFAGAAFGVGVALLIRLTQVERWLIHPRIEAKVSFSVAPAVQQALDMLENGEVVLAERRLKVHLDGSPNDVEAVMALVRVYELMRNHPEMSAMTSRLMTYYLRNGDNRQALMSYESLQGAIGNAGACLDLPAREWFILCEFLERLGRFPEAAAEYEWLAQHHRGTPAELRSYVKGGEAAVRGGIFQEAVRLFRLAEQMTPAPGFARRITEGLERCGEGEPMRMG